MRQRLRPHLTYANVMATVAVFLALGGVGAIAATSSCTGGIPCVNSDDIIDGQVRNPDLADDAVTNLKIADSAVNQDTLAIDSVGTGEILAGAVTTSEVLNDTVTGGGLAQVDLRPNSVGQSEIKIGAVASPEVANGTLDVSDLNSSSVNQLATYTAVVSANGTWLRGRGSIFGGTSRFQVGGYSVQFFRDVTNCTVAATIEPVGNQVGEIGVAPSGDHVLVGTYDSTGTYQDRKFHLTVNC